jgi:hypothetical protein
MHKYLSDEKFEAIRKNISRERYVNAVNRHNLAMEYGYYEHSEVFIDFYIPAPSTFIERKNSINIHSDNMIELHEKEIASHCYNRNLLYNGIKDNALIGKCHDITYNTGAHVSSFSIPKYIDLQACNVSSLSDMPGADKIQSLSGAPVAIDNPVENSLTDYYQRKLAYINRKFGNNTEQHNLRVNALSDMVARFLDDNDSTDGNQQEHFEKVYGRCISNISAAMKAKKRPQQSDKTPSVIYDNEGNEIDSMELIAVNARSDSNFEKKARKVLKGIDLEYFNLFMESKSEKEIADALGKSVRTSRRIKKSVIKSIKSISDDLIEYIDRQEHCPSYAWVECGKSNWASHSEPAGDCKHIDVDSYVSSCETYIVNTYAMALYLS